MKSLLEDLIDYFASHNLVAGDGVDCFRDFSPEKPDNIIIVSEYGGDEVPYYEDSAAHRSIQIAVRNVESDDARYKAFELFKSLKTDTKFVQFNESRWGQVTLRQVPFKIKQDENKRTVYGFNVGITTNIE